MTETPSHQKLLLEDCIRRYMADHGALDEQQVIIHAVLLVETKETRHGRPVYGRHRMYPLGEMDPHTECGLLIKAAEDAQQSPRL